MSGRMDVQARADAMADAETLRRFVFRSAREGQYEAIADALRLASHGATAIVTPRLAARAAFRAVPGLAAPEATK